MHPHPLTDALIAMAEASSSTVEELLAQAAGTRPATSSQTRALRAGWASYDLESTIEPEGDEQ